MKSTEFDAQTSTYERQWVPSYVYIKPTTENS